MLKGKKLKLILKDLKYLWNYYRNNKKHVAKFFSLSITLFFASLVFFGGKFFYPFHSLIAFTFFAFSLRVFYICFFSYKKELTHFNTYNLSRKYGRKYRNYILISVLVIFLAYTGAKVFYFKDSPFKDIKSNEAALSAFIEKDLDIAILMMDRLEVAGLNLLASPLLKSSELSVDERVSLENLWTEFLLAARYSEIITDRHKYFNHISYFKYREENSKSFMITYSLYMKKYELFHQLISIVNGNEYIQKVLNENNEELLARDLYQDIVTRFFNTETVLRQGLGGLYLQLIKLTGNENYGYDYNTLKQAAHKSTKFLVANIDSSLWNSLKAAKSIFEMNMFKTWFPIQKNAADFLGDFYISSRHDKFITIAQIIEMEKEMEPGDIMLERRNWYASNIGIPGFWPHAVLYIGDLEQANEYFQEVFPYGGFSTYYEFLEGTYPELYKNYTGVNEANYDYSVIESISEGVLIHPLEVSAEADYAAVMRPRLSKLDKLKALERAFDNYGKPYDFDFDFDTQDAIVCSELVYDAYLSTKDKKGIYFELNQITGRKITSPTDMAKKYADEYQQVNPELDFVYFLDGSEEEERAFVRGEKEFVESWKRSKYDWSQD